jgi:hypothetical protein
LEKKNRVVLKERDSEDQEVYNAEFIEEIPVKKAEKLPVKKPVFSTAVKILGNLGSLALFFLKTSDVFRKNRDDNSGKNRLRLRKRRKR